MDAVIRANWPLLRAPCGTQDVDGGEPCSEKRI
jgi:hypothetical protein